MATFQKITEFGRFGNQLFQLAATYAHSKRMNENAWLSSSKHSHFCKIFPNFHKFFIASARPSSRTHNEPSFSFSDIPNEKNLNLHGYFQSEKYFVQYSDDIAEMFDLGTTRNDSLCAIHVRRGDYVKYPKTYPLLAREYYIPAIQRQLQINHNLKFKVFSDDAPTAKKIFDDQKNIEFSVGRSELQDFKEMITAGHHIIANSSFSWWSSWLSFSNHIVAPKNWFVDGYADWQDIYTERMLIV